MKCSTMAKRRPKASRLRSGADAAETKAKDADSAAIQKSSEPKAKKSRLAKSAEVIRIDSSPEKEIPKRTSKLSRNNTPDQRRKDEQKCTKGLDPEPQKMEHIDRPPNLESKPAEKKDEMKRSSCVSFDTRKMFYNHDQEFSSYQNDLSLGSQSIEAQCDVIWQSTSPISLTQAARVTSKNTTNTADLIKKFSYKNADPGSPVLKTCSTPPLLGLWSSTSTGKAHAKRRMRGWGMKRPGTGPGTSSEDIIMKLSLVLESKSEPEEPDSEESPKSPVIGDEGNQTGSQSKQSNEQGMCASQSKEHNSSLDLFESEGYLTQPTKSPTVVNYTVADANEPDPATKPIEMADMKLEAETLDVREKAVSQGFMVSSVGNAKEPVPKVMAEKPVNQSCEDLWTDDDFDDDSFVLKATQELFESEAFSSPKTVKSLSKTSTPVGGKKGGRLTFTLNPVNVSKPVATTTQSSVTTEATITDSVAKAKTPSNNTKTVNSNDLSKTRQITGFKKPLPAAVVSAPISSEPFQSYGHNNSSNGTSNNTAPSNSVKVGVKSQPPPKSSVSFLKTQPTKPVVAGAQARPVVGASNAVQPSAKNSVINMPNTFKPSQGSFLSHSKSSIMPNRTVAADKPKDANSKQFTSSRMIHPTGVSVSVKSGAIVKKPETVASMSVSSELEIMDTSLGDDLLLSLAEPDEQLDKPQPPNKTDSENQGSCSVKNHIPSKTVTIKQQYPIVKNKLPSKADISIKRPSIAVGNQVPSKVSKQTPALMNETESAWDEDEDDDLLLMTSQALESSLRTAPAVKTKPVSVPPKISHTAKHGAPATKSYSFTRTTSMIGTNTKSTSGPMSQGTAVHLSSSSNQSYSKNPAFSKMPAPVQTTSVTATSVTMTKPSQIIPGPTNPSASLKPSPVLPSTRTMAGPPVPTLTTSRSISNNCTKTAMLPKRDHGVDQPKDFGMDDAFPGDDEMLCEDQVLAMLDNIESQQISQKAGSSVVLCSTQKPIPGATQQSKNCASALAKASSSTATLSSGKFTGKPESFGKSKAVQNLCMKSSLKTPLVLLSDNRSRAPPKGTPPIPDVSPIKPYSQSTDGLLGSTINLAIVDKHYPKCSPDEIERKKAEALKRRQKKKPSSRKLSTVV